MIQDNTAEQQDFDDQEADRLFDEFSSEDTTPAPDPDAKPQDDQGFDGEQEDEAARDDQGRFTAQDDGEQEPEETTEQRLERLEKEAQQWQHRYQSDLGRQSALQRKVQQLEEENRKLQQSPGKGQAQAREDNPEGSGLSDEDWKTLQEDFPEIAKGIEQQLSRVTQRYESQLNELKSQITPIQERAAEQDTQVQLGALSERHPDWQQTVQTPDFINWLEQQPADVQKLTDSPYAADAAFLLDSYKAITGLAQREQPAADRQKRNQRRLQSAQTVPSRGGRQRSEIPDNDEDALFDYFADKADR